MLLEKTTECNKFRLLSYTAKTFLTYLNRQVAKIDFRTIIGVYKQILIAFMQTKGKAKQKIIKNRGKK